MRASAGLWIISAMTRPDRSSKLVLVEDRRSTSTAEPDAGVRRYRLARLRLESRSAEHAWRFEHLKRVYD